MRIEADLVGKRIVVQFPYDPVIIRRAKQVPGYSYVPPDKGGPHWSYPADLKTARLLKENFGRDLTPSAKLRAWGIEQTRKQRQLRSMVHADDAELKLAKQHKVFNKYLRPYQRADVAMMAANNVCNANDPGLGKTVEVIAAALEARIQNRPNLIIAPVTSLEVVWEDEIRKWIPNATILRGDTPAERKEAAAEAKRLSRRGKAFWLLINPAILTKVALDLKSVKWGCVVIDEFHKMGLNNPKSLFSAAAKLLGKNAYRRWALSGTPMGGVPINMWAVFNWLDPVEFSSRWRWADQWLTITSNGFGREIGDIKPGREDEFYEYHARWLVRRTKSEVLTQLPPKQYHDIWCRMTNKQLSQYRKFERDAEIRIDEQRLVGTSVLAEYARLKMFAFGSCYVDNGVQLPTSDSAKLDALLNRLHHHGVNEPGGQSAVVGSQFSRVCYVVHEWLNDRGIDTALITGDTPPKERAQIVRAFQEGRGPRVIVMTTTAGGVSITLDRADSMHILDETWNPDDQLQLEDRIHRGSRNHQVTVYYYRSKETIEEEIARTTEFKALNNTNILDFHRRVSKGI